MLRLSSTLLVWFGASLRLLHKLRESVPKRRSRRTHRPAGWLGSEDQLARAVIRERCQCPKPRTQVRIECVYVMAAMHSTLFLGYQSHLVTGTDSFGYRRTKPCLVSRELIAFHVYYSHALSGSATTSSAILSWRIRAYPVG